MNLPLNPKTVASAAIRGGQLVPAGAVTMFPTVKVPRENGVIPVLVKLPEEVGLRRDPNSKPPRRYRKKKSPLPLTPVTKAGKHLFIIYPR